MTISLTSCGDAAASSAGVGKCSSTKRAVVSVMLLRKKSFNSGTRRLQPPQLQSVAGSKTRQLEAVSHEQTQGFRGAQRMMEKSTRWSQDPPFEEQTGNEAGIQCIRLGLLANQQLALPLPCRRWRIAPMRLPPSAARAPGRSRSVRSESHGPLGTAAPLRFAGTADRPTEQS